jgi:transcriptional regulator NrdR family protein
VPRARTTPAVTEPCPTCTAPVAAVVISLDEQVVKMRSCNACDQRWWTAEDGERIDPTRVFARR